MTNYEVAKRRKIKFDRSEYIDAVTPGQVFVDDGKRVQHTPCWMLVCEHNYGRSEVEIGDDENDESDYGGEFYLVPLLPDDFAQEIEDKIFDLREKCVAPIEFLERQNGTFYLSGNSRLIDFWQQRPSFTSEEQPAEILPLIKATVSKIGKCLFPSNSYDELFMRHFYIAPDEARHLLLILFDDDAYRPEVTRALFRNTNQVLRYEDLYERFIGMAKLPMEEVDYLFRNVDELAINALNDGMNNFTHIATTGIAPTNPCRTDTECQAEQFSVLNDLQEVNIVPTIWYDMRDESANVCLDAWGKWQRMKTGRIWLDYGQFYFRHDPGSKGAGMIRKRKAV